MNAPNPGNAMPPPLASTAENAHPLRDRAARYAALVTARLVGCALGGLIGLLLWAPVPQGKRTEWSNMGDKVSKTAYVGFGIAIGLVAGSVAGLVIAARMGKARRNPQPPGPAGDTKN